MCNWDSSVRSRLAGEPLPDAPARRPGHDGAAGYLSRHRYAQSRRHLGSSVRLDSDVAAADRHVVGIDDDARLGHNQQVAAAYVGVHHESRIADDCVPQVKLDVSAGEANLHALWYHPWTDSLGGSTSAVDSG